MHSFVERVFAGRGYAGRLVDRTRDEANLVLEIVRRSNLDANRCRHNAVQVGKWFIELVAARPKLCSTPHRLGRRLRLIASWERLTIARVEPLFPLSARRNLALAHLLLTGRSWARTMDGNNRFGNAGLDNWIGVAIHG